MPSAGGLASLVGVPPSSMEDLMYIKAYIHSLDMLKILEKKIDIKKLYQSQTIDPFYKLYGWMSQEGYLWYYQNRVELVYDEVTGLLTIKAEGFSPEDANTISQAILKESERFINELSHKISREQMKFAENELNNAKNRYQEAKNKLIAFQNEYGVLDPKAQAEAKTGLTLQIETQIATKETELSSKKSFLNDNAPEVVVLKSEIEALKKQLLKEKEKIIANSKKTKLNNLASRFQELMVEAGFAEDAYKVALASLETTRIEASKKIKQLVVIQSPTLPETAEYPNKIYNIVTAFIILSLLFGIIRLIKAIIEEHKY
jgi:capsular polysaccharide transport system permease protein